MSYLLLRNLHAGLALTSLALFILRVAAVLAGAHWPARRWARILPHLVDSLLLLLGVSLLVRLGLWPHQLPWLLAKLSALVVYIALGVAVMRSTRPAWQRGGLAVLAVAVFGYMLAVALSKSPWPLG